MTDFEITYRGARLDQGHYDRFTPGEKIAWKHGVDAALGAPVGNKGSGVDYVQPPLRTWIVGPKKSGFQYSHLFEVTPGVGHWADTRADAESPEGPRNTVSIESPPLTPGSLGIDLLEHWDLREITPGVEFAVERGFHEPAAKLLKDTYDGTLLRRVGDGCWEWQLDRGDTGFVQWDNVALGGYTFRVIEEL